MTTVYETIRIKDGRLPLVQRHLARLAKGCEALGMSFPRDLPTRLDALRLNIGDDSVLRVEWDGSELRLIDRPMPSVAPVSIATSSIVHPGYEIKTTVRTAFERALHLGRDDDLEIARLVDADDRRLVLADERALRAALAR